MRRFERRGNIGSSAKTGIDEPPLAELFESVGINCAALRLDEHWTVPVDAEPLEIPVNVINELGPRAGLVEILDAQTEFAAGFARPRVAENRAVSVSQMQPSGGRRRETGDDHAAAP